MLEKIKDILGLNKTPLEKYRRPLNKIEWDHFFLREAFLWATRSHDGQTQCGCVLTRNKTVLSTGYNGFIRNIDDSILPNLRPHKYPFMIHAELNALLNCAYNGISTKGSTAYCTTFPCHPCFQSLYQAGIKRIVYCHAAAHMTANDKERSIIQVLMTLINRTIYASIDPDGPIICTGSLQVDQIPYATLEISNKYCPTQ